MPRDATTNSWRFPPRTREVQVDEKWGFVLKKEASCDPLDPLDRLRGDDWDHTAVDPESRLLLALVPGKRDGPTCERLIRQARDRTGGPVRPPKPVKVVPPELCYATVRKRREKGRVVEVVRTLVFGTLYLLCGLLKRSTASTTINTSFVERHN